MNFSETIHFLITGKKPDGGSQTNPHPDPLPKGEGEKPSPSSRGNEGEKSGVKKKNISSSKSEDPSFNQKFQQSIPSHTEMIAEQGFPLESEINDDERVFAGISYFPFLSIFSIFTRKESPFVMFHAWQGFAIMAVFLGSLPFYFLFKFIPGFGFLFWLFYVVLFGYSFFAGFSAWSGKYIQIPIISGFAKTLSGR